MKEVDIRQCWRSIEGGGEETKGKCPPQKIHANDGPACQIIAGGKIS